MKTEWGTRNGAPFFWFTAGLAILESAWFDKIAIE
jgi:hypothetical protein